MLFSPEYNRRIGELLGRPVQELSRALLDSSDVYDFHRGSISMQPTGGFRLDLVTADPDDKYALKYIVFGENQGYLDSNISFGNKANIYKAFMDVLHSLEVLQSKFSNFGVSKFYFDISFNVKPKQLYFIPDTISPIDPGDNILFFSCSTNDSCKDKLNPKQYGYLAYDWSVYGDQNA